MVGAVYRVVGAGKGWFARGSSCWHKVRPVEQSFECSFIFPRNWGSQTCRPVLKHGPRSLTCMRVLNCGIVLGEMKVNLVLSSARPLGRSKSVCVGTRKMVNYAWIGQSQRKLWWRLVAVLTCKSMVEFGYRGERLIEPSSSWFPPKFPPG